MPFAGGKIRRHASIGFYGFCRPKYGPRSEVVRHRVLSRVKVHAAVLSGRKRIARNQVVKAFFL